TKAALQPYLARLGEYGAALEAAHRDLSAAAAEAGRAEDLLDALAAKAATMGWSDDPTLTGVAELTRSQLAANPAVLPVVNELLAAYSARLDYLKTRAAS
ncbi:MAG: hypothetical protein REI45_12455, partial [Propionicimonas sp.]|nr:hypothetical protein [Propionicimonas sp.]